MRQKPRDLLARMEVHDRSSMIGVPVEPFTFDRFVMTMIGNGLIWISFDSAWMYRV